MRVLYVITSLSHKRVFETFEPRNDMKQLVVGPNPIISNTIVPEDYSDFSLPVKLFKEINDIQKIVDQFSPNIYVKSDLSIAHNKLNLPSGCKIVLVSHGMVGSHVKGIIKKAGFNTSVWKGADLYCGATKIFEDWIKHVAKVDSSKILLNALPQLDILHDSNYYNSYRQRVLARTGHPNAKRVLLFVGFCCKDRLDFNSHNEDYFRSVIELEKIARKHDWLVMVKPRQTLKEMMKFLQRHKWGKKYVKPYTDIQKSKHLHFITTTGHIYRYFFADAIVINGTSTVEVEACAIQKPLFVVRTCLQAEDPFGMITASAAMSVPDIVELEHDLAEYFVHGRFHWPDNQKQRLIDMGIKFDGQMHNRVQDRIAKT